MATWIQTLLSRVASTLILCGMIFLPHVMPTSALVSGSKEFRYALNESARIDFIFCGQSMSDVVGLCYFQHVRLYAPSNDCYIDLPGLGGRCSLMESPLPDDHNCIICAVIISTTKMEDEGKFSICKLTHDVCVNNHTVTLIIERPTEKQESSTRNPTSAAPPGIKETTSDILTTKGTRDKSTKSHEPGGRDSPRMNIQKGTSNPAVIVGIIVVIVVIVIVVIAMLWYKKRGANCRQTDDYHLATN